MFVRFVRVRLLSLLCLFIKFKFLFVPILHSHITTTNASSPKKKKIQVLQKKLISHLYFCASELWDCRCFGCMCMFTLLLLLPKVLNCVYIKHIAFVYLSDGYASVQLCWISCCLFFLSRYAFSGILTDALVFSLFIICIESNRVHVPLCVHCTFNLKEKHLKKKKKNKKQNKTKRNY